MDDRHFDDLTRRFAAGLSRRAALRGAVAGMMGILGLPGTRAEAQVSQVFCGNQACASNPGGCRDGCVCCVYTNPVTGRVFNSRCRPPGTCGPGTQIGGSPTTTTARPTTTTARPTTTPAPTSTTTTSTSTTAVPTTTTTTSSTTSSTTTTPAPTTTTSTTAPPARCATAADCDDGVGCTVDTCVDGVCRHTPDDGLCPPTGSDCHRAVCGPSGCTTAIAAGASCLYPDNRCVTSGICDGEGFCLPLSFVDCSGFVNECNEAFCQPATGTCQRTPVMDGRPCDDGNPCTGTGTCSGGTCRTGAPITCPADRPDCDGGSCVCRGNGLECPPPGSGVGCCDGQCVRGVCCTPTGQFCDVNEQCCSRSCIRVGFNRECA